MYDEVKFEEVKDSILEPARLQVKNRGYGVNYYNDGRPVLGAMLAISAQERRIVAWREFNPNPNVGVREGLCQPVDMSNKNAPLSASAKTKSTHKRTTKGAKSSKAAPNKAATSKTATSKAPRARKNSAPASKSSASTKATRSATATGRLYILASRAKTLAFR